MTPPIRAVLFDWGDTLFFSPRAADVIVAAARERGVEVDPAAAAALWDRLWAAGKTPEEHAKGRDLSAGAHRAVWTALFAPADDVAPGLAALLYERVMHPSRWRPYPDTPFVLRELRRRGVKTGIVSNVALDIRPLFATHGLDGLVDSFALSFEHGIAKPAPALFAAACRDLGVAPAETLMVGDDPVTDGGAAAAGLRVHVLPSPQGEGPRGFGPVLALVDASRAPA
jgi:HAD superfamily hydrolase (TIGR01509 family)